MFYVNIIDRYGDGNKYTNSFSASYQYACKTANRWNKYVADEYAYAFVSTTPYPTQSGGF